MRRRRDFLGLIGGSAAAHPAPAADTTPPLVISPIAFGADPTGKADSAPAFARIQENHAGARHLHIFIPAGRYLLKSRVVFRASGNETNYGFHIEGAGEDATEIVADNAEGGFAFEGTHIARMSFRISNLSLVAPRDNCGTALAFDTANPGVHNSRQFTAENLLIRGERFDTGNFVNGIVARNAWFPLFRNVKISQQYGGKVMSLPMQSRWNMKHAMLLQDCYTPILADCNITGGEFGLAHRAVGTNPEDGAISRCYFVGQREGVAIDLEPKPGPWPEPGFHISDSHFNCHDYGLRLRGVMQANIDHCLFYCSDDTASAYKPSAKAPRDFDPCDIFVEYGWNIVVDGNIFHEPSNPRRIGVRIGPRSGYVMVRGNQFNHQGRGIKNEAEKLPNFATDNVFGGQPDWFRNGTRYIDATGTLRIRDIDGTADAPVTSRPVKASSP